MNTYITNRDSDYHKQHHVSDAIKDSMSFKDKMLQTNLSCEKQHLLEDAGILAETTMIMESSSSETTMTDSKPTKRQRRRWENYTRTTLATATNINYVTIVSDSKETSTSKYLSDNDIISLKNSRRKRWDKLQ